jgi:hypothetical protein
MASRATQIVDEIYKVKLLGSECQTSGTYAKRAEQATKRTTPRLACVF